MLLRHASALALLVAASPAFTHRAFAHPGNHAGLSLVEFVQHYAEPDHLLFLTLTVIVGISAYYYGRRVEAKARAAVRTPERDRG